MKTIHTSPNLNEKNLGNILEAVFGEENVTRQKSVNVGGRNLRIDYQVKFRGKTIFVEFNGPTHYTNTKVILRDYDLRSYCEENGIRLVEIPYFIQITNGNFAQFFGLEFEDLLTEVKITSEVQCGFVSEKIVLPFDYCFLGIGRFYSEYGRSSGKMFYDSTTKCEGDWWDTMREIFTSLWNRSESEMSILSYFFEKMEMDAFYHYPT